MLRAWMQETVEPQPVLPRAAGSLGRRANVAPGDRGDAERRARLRGSIHRRVRSGPGSMREAGAGSARRPTPRPTSAPRTASASASPPTPLPERLEILGFPEVVLTLSADRPRALVCVRLCDVAEDGASLLVTRGLLNLTHRDGHEEPEPLEPGEAYTVARAPELDRARVPPRPPPAGRRLPDLLALGLALARAGDPDAPTPAASSSRSAPSARRTPSSHRSATPKELRRSRTSSLPARRPAAASSVTSRPAGTS